MALRLGRGLVVQKSLSCTVPLTREESKKGKYWNPQNRRKRLEVPPVRKETLPHHASLPGSAVCVLSPDESLWLRKGVDILKSTEGASACLNPREATNSKPRKANPKNPQSFATGRGLTPTQGQAPDGMFLADFTSHP